MEIKKDKYSVKYFPTEVKSYKQEGQTFYFYTAETTLEVRVFSDKIVRFRYAPDGTFQRDFSYAITEGGPLSSTYVLALYIYDQSFRFFNLGYGAALSWVLFGLVALLSGISFWSSRYWVFYAGEKETRQ